MSATSPKMLQNAAFHVVSKMFTLCDGVEHRSLKLSQIKQNTIHLKKKVVPIYACPDAGERSSVYILDKYISKLPSSAIAKALFYVRLL